MTVRNTGTVPGRSGGLPFYSLHGGPFRYEVLNLILEAGIPAAPEVPGLHAHRPQGPGSHLAVSAMIPWSNGGVSLDNVACMCARSPANPLPSSFRIVMLGMVYIPSVSLKPSN